MQMGSLLAVDRVVLTVSIACHCNIMLSTRVRQDSHGSVIDGHGLVVRT